MYVYIYVCIYLYLYLYIYTTNVNHGYLVKELWVVFISLFVLIYISYKLYKFFT